MRCQAIIVAGLVALIKAQTTVGPDLITTFTTGTPYCTATGLSTYAFNDGVQNFIFMCGAGSNGVAAVGYQSVQGFSACAASCDAYNVSGTLCNGYSFYGATAFQPLVNSLGSTVVSTGSCSVKTSSSNFFQTFNTAMVNGRVGVLVRTSACKTSI